MAATFRPVNTPVIPEHAWSGPTITPTSASSSSAPTLATAASLVSSQPHTPTMADDAKTPTRATFKGSTTLAGQKPLPTSPFPQAVQFPEVDEAANPIPKRGNSQHSQKSRDSEDVDMEGSDADGKDKEDNEGSDHESENADGKSSKKKKSQRFYCTDYPPCKLSFTRSEHLARHIRKHTGERPFQCHCSRRFSRLDNLRQHAQTVHVNEDIPIDSLAATGARFQRQAMRPDRVRQQTGRARASTAGSATGVVRGHSKSLSTSSINSIASNVSTRDRPPPLVMADSRAKLSLESYSSARDGNYPQYRAVSPSDFSTPTSATFSTGQSSPRWSGYASPTSSHSRSQSMYTEARTPNRRLSVPAPAGNNPFSAPIGVNVGRPSFATGAVNASNSGSYSSAASSLLSSPTIAGSHFSRRDSVSSSADEAWRRRTWHPDSQNFHPSRLSSVITPGQYDSAQGPPLAQPTNQSTGIRLPGIESFGPLPHRPTTPPKRNPSPMVVDSDAQHPPSTLLPGPASLSEDRRGFSQWDMSLHRGINRLEITSPSRPRTGAPTPTPRDSARAWANEANQAVQAQAEQASVTAPTVRFDCATPSYPAGNAPVGPRVFHQHTVSAPSVSLGRDHRRHGWYNDPMQTHAEETKHNRIERMVHPNIDAFSGFPARDGRQNQAPPQGPERVDNPERLRGLEALVAVATGEGNTAAAY